MYDLWYTACIRNGFIEYGLVNSVEQFFRWQIEYKMFLYYLLCMICGTLHVKEMVSLNMSLFLVRNDTSVGKLKYKIFLYYLPGMICGKLDIKEMVSLIWPRSKCGTIFLLSN